MKEKFIYVHESDRKHQLRINTDFVTLMHESYIHQPGWIPATQFDLMYYKEHHELTADSFELAAQHLESRGLNVRSFPYESLNEQLKDHGLDRIGLIDKELELIDVWTKKGDRTNGFDRDNTYYYKKYKTKEGAIVLREHIVTDKTKSKYGFSPQKVETNYYVTPPKEEEAEPEKLEINVPDEEEIKEKRREFLQNNPLSDEILKKIERAENAIEKLIVSTSDADEAVVGYDPVKGYLDGSTAYGDDDDKVYRDGSCHLGVTFNDEKGWDTWGFINYLLSKYYVEIITKVIQYIENSIPWPEGLRFDDIYLPWGEKEVDTPKKLFICDLDYDYNKVDIFDLETGKILAHYSSDRSDAEDSKKEFRDFWRVHQYEDMVVVSDRFPSWVNEALGVECVSWGNLNTHTIGTYMTSEAFDRAM